MLTSLISWTRAPSWSGQEGGITIVSAIAIGTFALLASGSLHVGNWYVHRRHLQLQTDAAAFAAGQRFGLCVSSPGSAFADMQALADTFGGFATGAFNAQVGTGTGYRGTVQRVFNSQPYPTGSSHPADPDAIPADPCTEPQMFDVKATETTIPRLFSFLPLGEVNAHSRVELKAINEMKGLLPLAVPDVRPQYVFAHFFDANGTQIAMVQLAKGAAVGNRQTWTAPATVPIPVGIVRVQIRLVGADDPSLACGQLYTECYDTVRIRGWNPATAAPKAQDVWILSDTCLPDAYYAENDCTAGLQADVNLGDANPVTAATRVFATVAGSNVKYQLAPARLGTGVIRWTISSGLPLSGAGLHAISLGYNTGTGGDKSFGVVHGAVVAEPGPIELVQISVGGASGANTYPTGSQTFDVSVQTLGNLLLSQPGDAPIYLRLFKSGGSASQNQSLDCDKNLATFRDELAQGCEPFYIRNPSLQCPYANANALWDVWYVDRQSMPCVNIQTGAAVGQISQGLEDRLFPDGNVSCDASPVNWDREDGFDYEDPENADDRRALPLFVTPLGTFSGTGSDMVPVIDFGFFYVTGYKGDPCEGVDPDQDPVPANRGALVRGHFIKFFPLDNVVPSDELCDFDSITPCVGVLTR